MTLDRKGRTLAAVRDYLQGRGKRKADRRTTKGASGPRAGMGRRPRLPRQIEFHKIRHPKKRAFLASEEKAKEGLEPYKGVLPLLKKARRQSSGKAAKKQVWGPAG